MITPGANTARRRRNWRVLRSGWNNKFQRSESTAKSNAFPAIWKRTWLVHKREPVLRNSTAEGGQAPRTPHASHSSVAAWHQRRCTRLCKPVFVSENAKVRAKSAVCAGRNNFDG